MQALQRKKSKEDLLKAYENLQLQSKELQAQSEEIQSQNEELLTQSEELSEAYEILRESETKYHDLFETVQEVFYIDRLIYDKQVNVVDWILEDLNSAGFKVVEAVKAERRRLFEILDTLQAMVCLLTSDY